MYLDISFDQCVLPTHVKRRLSNILSAGNKLPNMIMHGWSFDEFETIALAYAKKADMYPIKITPKQVKSVSRHYSMSRSFVNTLEGLLRSVTADSQQNRLVIITDLSGLSKKDHQYLADVVTSNTRGTVLFHEYALSKMPKVLRESLPCIGLDFSLNQRNDTASEIYAQSADLLHHFGLDVPEHDLHQKVQAVYPRWTKLVDEFLLKEFSTTSLKPVRYRKGSLPLSIYGGLLRRIKPRSIRIARSPEKLLQASLPPRLF